MVKMERVTDAYILTMTVELPSVKFQDEAKEANEAQV